MKKGTYKIIKRYNKVQQNKVVKLTVKRHFLFIKKFNLLWHSF